MFVGSSNIQRDLRLTEELRILIVLTRGGVYMWFHDLWERKKEVEKDD